jgi:hypothetical protein
MDTLVTLAKLARGFGLQARALIPRYQIYLSCTGGPILDLLETHYRLPRPANSFVPGYNLATPRPGKTWDLGKWARKEDRQPALDELLLEPARNRKQSRFVVAGLQYPRISTGRKCEKASLSAARKRASIARRNLAELYAENGRSGLFAQSSSVRSHRLWHAVINVTGDSTPLRTQPGNLITHSAETPCVAC